MPEVKSSDALRRAKAKYFQKNKERIYAKTRDYHRVWVQKRRAYNEAAEEFRMILLSEA